MQAAKNTFLVNHSEAQQNAALVTETLAGNAMAGVESASEMINMISTSDINVSLEKSIIPNFTAIMDMLGMVMRLFSFQAGSTKAKRV